MPKYRFPSDAESARKIEEIDALISKVMKLWKEMVKVREKMCWFRDCPLETALGIEELVNRAKEFHELCYQYHYLLLEGNFVSEADIAGLREGYEKLKGAWLEFLAKNGLGIIYL